MKRALFILVILGLAFSPLTVTQAQAAPVKHHHAVRHHRKVVKKNAHRAVRRHRRHAV